LGTASADPGIHDKYIASLAPVDYVPDAGGAHMVI